MIARLIGKVWWERYFRRNACPWEELEQFPQLPPDRQRQILAQRLLDQIRYFGNREDSLPEWREAAEINDPDELWRVWPFLPILDKQTLQSRFQPGEMQARFKLQGIASSTGGSTGEPTAYFHDIRMMRANAALIAFARLRMGWRPGMAIIVVWGSERDIGKSTALRARLHNRLRRVFLVDGYNLTEQTVCRVLALVKRHRPVAVYGFTSMLEFVAQKTIDLDLIPHRGSVQIAWNGGEMLYEHQDAVFRTAFGVPILNCYGGRELGVMACQSREGSPLHVFRPWQFVEVVDEKGKLAGPGESGRLLWTSTVCRGTPFLRYEIGDLGMFDRAHADESGILCLQELHGRTAGLLRLPNGKLINCIFWNHLFKEFSEVQQFQVILTKNGGLQFLLKGRGFTAPRETCLSTTLKNFVGDLPLQISWVEKIPLTLQGKLVQVVQEK